MDATRRLFVGLAGTALLAQLARQLPAWAAQQELKPAQLPPAPAGHLAAPRNEAEWTLWWLAETIVPGTATDPEGAPGANDCGALNVMLDPQLPLAANVDLVVLSLDGTAQSLYDKPFRELNYEQRAAVAAQVESQVPLMTLLYRLIRAAFYGAAYNEVGVRWMGFPGENLGYIDHPDFTIGPVGTELTETGYLP
jgi:hypothetical protein